MKVACLSDLRAMMELLDGMVFSVMAVLDVVVIVRSTCQDDDRIPAARTEEPLKLIVRIMTHQRRRPVLPRKSTRQLSSCVHDEPTLDPHAESSDAISAPQMTMKTVSASSRRRIASHAQVRGGAGRHGVATSTNNRRCELWAEKSVKSSPPIRRTTLIVRPISPRST